jgi:undecaprenyl diphosphate synthase
MGSDIETKVPQCVGIIMDGNRRWARKRGLPTLEGHRRGYQKLKEVADWCRAAGIKHVIVYAFSTENWNRSAEEVSYLMDLFNDMIFKELEWLKKEDARVHFVGQRERFDPKLQKGMDDLERETKDGTYNLYVALSYGGRAEILHAVKKAVSEKGVEGVKNMTEDDFARFLWTGDMPDPDIIIRTSGEHRLSGFLAWQSVYSELFFTDTQWPAFTEEEFRDIIKAYGERDRRKGK